LNKVITIKEFEFDCLYGEIEYFTYQIALGVSIRRFEDSWMFRIYFGPFKIWGNLGKKNY